MIIEDWAILGGGSLVHQFVRIGSHVMIQGGCKVVKDVPPYIMAGRDPVVYAGLNLVGLRRRNFHFGKNPGITGNLPDHYTRKVLIIPMP